MSADSRHPFLVIHGLIEYPFPLSDGSFAELVLPERLEADDADRLVEFITNLAVGERQET